MDAQETSLYNSILIVSAIIGSIIVYFVVSIVQQQRRNLRLYRQNIMAEITAMEKERARIAADLHDEVGPLLAAIKLKINSLDLHSEDDEKEVEKTNTHIDGLIRRMREISYDLLPNTLVRKGLISATREFVDYVSSSSNLHIRLQAPDAIAVPEQKSVHLYRILQEVIHNSLKHARASELEITLAVQEGTLILSTKDNGIGFDHHTVSKSSKGGIGLRSLLSRVELVGGQMFVTSGKNKGTQYTFEIPLDA